MIGLGKAFLVYYPDVAKSNVSNDWLITPFASQAVYTILFSTKKKADISINTQFEINEISLCGLGAFVLEGVKRIERTCH